jgi:phage terminase small subunit
LKQLFRRQQEILHEQKKFAAKGSKEGRADLEEKSFLIKKAAVLNQENLKEKLLMKRARDEMERTAFEILIPAAKQLKEEGKLDDALVEFKEALKMLTEAGWTSQTQSLRDEIADLEEEIKAGSPQEKSSKERGAVRNEVFEQIIPAARDAVADGDLLKGKELYEQAAENLRAIGWDEYIKPILANIREIDEKLSKKKAIEENITDDERKLIIREEVEMGMRFVAKDMKKYALLEFNKAIILLEQVNDEEMLDELQRQVKKIELEIKLEESKKLLVDRKKNT